MAAPQQFSTMHGPLFTAEDDADSHLFAAAHDDADSYIGHHSNKDGANNYTSYRVHYDNLPREMTGGIENWTLSALKSVIPPELHTLYLTSNNVLFAHGPRLLDNDNKVNSHGIGDESEHYDWVLQLTNNFKRSILSSFDVISHYQSLPCTKDSQRQRVAIDHKTDPSFIRVHSPASGRLILSNLLKCAAEQRNGLIKYVDYVRQNIELVPLLEELNRFALSQKIAYKRARTKLWFFLSLAQDLKLVQRTGTWRFKRLPDSLESQVERVTKDKQLTLFWFNHGVADCKTVSTPVAANPSVTSLNVSASVEGSSSCSNLDAINMNQLSDSFGVNSFLLAQMANSAGASSVYSSSNGPVSAGGGSAVANRVNTDNALTVGTIGVESDTAGTYTSVATANATMGTAVTGNSVSVAGSTSGVVSGTADSVGASMSFCTSGLQFDDSIYSSKITCFANDSTNWKALEMQHNLKLKANESKLKPITQHSLKDALTKYIDKGKHNKMENRARNSLITLSLLEAATKLYSKGPKWSNPNKAEFDSCSKYTKLVYVNPIKTAKNTDLAYQYLLQYASVHQKLNGGSRQEHAVQYGLIILDKPQRGEPIKGYKLNPEPWKIPEFADKWTQLSQSLKFPAPWIIRVFTSSSGRSSVVSEGMPDKSVATTAVKAEDRVDFVTGVECKVLDATVEAALKPIGNAGLVEDVSTSAAADTVADEVMPNKCAVDDKNNNSRQPQLKVVVDFDLEEKGNTFTSTISTAKPTSEVSNVLKESIDNENSILSPPDFKESLDSGVEAAQSVQADNDQPKSAVGEAPKESTNTSSMHLTTSAHRKQMKLPHLFQHVYNKINKVKKLPEVDFEQLGIRKRTHKVSEVNIAIPIATKRQRILDDNINVHQDGNEENANTGTSTITSASAFTDAGTEVETMPPDYVRIQQPTGRKEMESAKGAHKDESDSTIYISRKERIRKMRQVFQSMFDYEAEESDDENLSDPEDIKRSLQLLRQRLENSSGESEEEEEDNDDPNHIYAEMANFIEEVETVNEHDEEIARQKFQADMQAKEAAELAKLMQLKQSSEVALTRHEQRLKLLAQLKKAKNKNVDDLRLSDFESSDEEANADEAGKGKRRPVTKQQLEELLRYTRENSNTILSKTEELEQFVDYKLNDVSALKKKTGLKMREQLERDFKNRRMDSSNMMDVDCLFGMPTSSALPLKTSSLVARIGVVNKGAVLDHLEIVDAANAFASAAANRAKGSSRHRNVPNTSLQFGGVYASPKRQPRAFTMSSMRWDDSFSKPLSSPNLRPDMGMHRLNVHLVEKMESTGNGNSVLDSKENHIILSLLVSRRGSVLKNIGFTVLDFLKCSISVAEMSDNEFFTLVESVILQVGPSMVLVSTDNDPIELKRLKHVFNVCNIENVCMHCNYAKGQTASVQEAKISSALLHLLKQGDDIRNHSSLLSLPYAMESLLMALESLDVAANPTYRQKFSLDGYRVDKYLNMDRAAFASLSILSPNADPKGNDTLYGLLNKCRSPIGSRRLRMWISQPLTDVTEITKRHDCVEAFKGKLYKMLQAECLRKVPDLDSVVIKFRAFNTSTEVKGRARPSFEDLVRLYDCIVAINRTVHYVLAPYDGKHSKTIKETFTDPLKSTGALFEPFLRLVEKAIDLKEAERHNYIINRNFDSRLKEMANEIDDIRAEIENLKDELQLDLLGASTSRNGIKIIECNHMAFLFRVSKKDHQYIQDNENIEKVRLNKNEFLFTTPKLRVLCNKFRRRMSDYQDAQVELVTRVLKVASTYWVLVESYSNLIATLDILTAFAEVATTWNYVRPDIDVDGNELVLVAARHALVEAFTSSTRTFVPNDLRMNRETSRVHVTTGPNMGGKSTYIRQVGLIVVMNQIGSHVPCSRARIPIFHSILCRVGASDIQLRGVSTFLAEMVEAAAIIKTADEKSLAIIDELGRGTCTDNGFGLACAILKHLITEARCFCLCATHFHEMGSLAQEHTGVINKHFSARCVANKDKYDMVFLYEVKDGICTDSYAINVAEIAKMPPDVIENARVKLAQLQQPSCDADYPCVSALVESSNFQQFQEKLATIVV